MSEITEDAFGLADLRRNAREKVQAIKPSTPPPFTDNTTEADAIAARRGFVSRDPIPETPAAAAIPPAIVQPTAPVPAVHLIDQPRVAPPAKEPFEQIAFRMPYSKKRHFQDWCDANRYTYSEGLIWLMLKAEILK